MADKNKGLPKPWEFDKNIDLIVKELNKASGVSSPAKSPAANKPKTATDADRTFSEFIAERNKVLRGWINYLFGGDK